MDAKTLGNNSVSMNQKSLSNQLTQGKLNPVVSVNNISVQAPPVDKYMLHSKFIRVDDLNRFEKSFVDFFGFSELSGIFIINNASKQKWYVEQGLHALQTFSQTL
jgi:hypothetical protein